MNIYRRRDGRFEGRLAGERGSGQRGYLSFYGKSKNEVQQKMAAYVDGLRQEIPAQNLTVKKLFEDWMEAISVRVRESTLANYRMRMATHILPLFGELDTDELTAPRLQKFVSDKLKEGLTSNYVADIVATLKSMLRFGNRQYGIRNCLSSLILPKKRKPQVRLLTKPETSRLKEYLAQNDGLSSLGIALPLFTGLRLGELCGLRWSDIDLEEKTLCVNRIVQRIANQDGRGTRLVVTAPKSASSQRLIPLPDCLIERLRCHLRNKDCYLFSGSQKPLEPRTMQYRFQSVLKKEKLPSIHFHALRHMFATNCVELGFDIKSLSEILGHASVEITLNHYVHSSLEKKKAFMNRLSLC